MNEAQREYYEKLKKAIKENRTIVACALTAVVASKITHTITIDYVMSKTLPLLYAAGNENGVLQLQNTLMLDFINHKGLGDEVREYIPTWKNWKK